MEDASVELLDLNDFDIPIYSIDIEKEKGIPEAVHRFKSNIEQADGIIISFAEHNGSYTAAYKNLFDWTSRINMKVYQDKPVVLMATSPGPGGAQSVLGAATGSAGFFAMDVKGSFSLPSFFDNFDVEKGQITNGELADELATIMAQLG